MAAAVTTTSTTLEGQVFELLRELQELELALPADTRPDRVQMSIDVEAKEVTCTVALPFTFGGSGASITIGANAYLA